MIAEGMRWQLWLQAGCAAGVGPTEGQTWWALEVMASGWVGRWGRGVGVDGRGPLGTGFSLARVSHAGSPLFPFLSVVGGRPPGPGALEPQGSLTTGALEHNLPLLKMPWASCGP